MHDKRWWVLAFWVIGLFLVNAAAGGVGDDYRDDFNLPNVESKRGFDVLEAGFPEAAPTGVSGSIVFRADQGVDDPEVQAAMEELFAEVEKEDVVGRLISPYSDEGARQIASAGPEAGKVAYATVEFPTDAEFAEASKVRAVIDDNAPEIEGLQVQAGGQVFAEFETPSSEALGLAFAIVILIVAFGSVLAMGLPIGVALFGIGVGSALIMLISNVMAVPEFATILGAMIGIGVGIDYALLIVTRYREQLHSGHDVRESIGIAMDTAGRSVLFAGMTVVISLLGMLLMGVAFVQGLAVAASAVVFVTVLASLTLLPALLGFAGTRVEVTRRRGLIAAGLVAIGLIGFGLSISPLLIGFPLAIIVLLVGLAFKPLKVEVPRKAPKPLRETLAYRWSRVVQRRPWTVAILSTIALLILAAPLLGMRLGFGDESNYDESTSTRKAYDLLTDGFGAGSNGPLLLAAKIDGDVDPAALEAVTTAVAADPNVALASPAQLNDPENPSAAQWFVVPKTGPQAEETTDLVQRLRTDVLPPLDEQVGAEILVTGSVAVSIDFADLLAGRLPYFFAAVLILSFLLLMAVFRSLLVPLKAVIMNLLSIGAAYGIIVALFQWGWIGDVTGVEPAPIEPWMPMMLFAIVFGLSMDYEVFLLSRIREEWHRTGDSHRSVADGLAATAKVITAAAAIMVFVFGSFILESDRTAKLMGTGLALAILLDATVVRMLLVPATMELLGDRNWWLPKWLDRILPNVDVEGHLDDSPSPFDDEPGPGTGIPEPAPVTV
ncbi:MMPL family transporter [Aquihabitans daechungensis]|uniref:MMPL family transporter n=1 Tax=Aquihabitans daechungensis TaxID=1052257 RepID=UPI003BA0B29D